MEGEKSQVRNHGLLMTLVSVVSFGVVAVLSFLGVFGSVGLYALILLCPLLHFALMRRTGLRWTSGSGEGRFRGPKGNAREKPADSHRLARR